MFGRQHRKQVKALEALHEELSAADLHARAVLNDAIAQIELRLARDREDRERAQSLTETAIEKSHVDHRESERRRTPAGHTCASVAERLDADRYERRAVEAIAWRSRPRPPSHVHTGGTVFPDRDAERHLNCENENDPDQSGLAVARKTRAPNHRAGSNPTQIEPSRSDRG